MSEGTINHRLDTYGWVGVAISCITKLCDWRQSCSFMLFIADSGDMIRAKDIMGTRTSMFFLVRRDGNRPLGRRTINSAFIDRLSVELHVLT